MHSGKPSKWLKDVNARLVNRGGSEVSGLKEQLRNLESRHKKLRERVATHGSKLAETR
jgi:hypothetical protein